MKKLFYLVVLVLTLSLPICLSSCNGCTEEAASRLYDVDLDLDDDGDYGDRSGETGNNPSFRGSNVKYGDKSVKHTYNPYKNIPDQCKDCGFSYKNGNHY